MYCSCIAFPILRISHTLVLFTKGVYCLYVLAVPSKPRMTNIANRTDTLLQVEWERPINTNGKLLGYVIFWSLPDRNATWNHTIYTNGDDAVASYVIRFLGKEYHML